jgi:ribosome maturation factor RimP
MDIIEQIKSWSKAFLADHLFVVDVEWKAGSKKISVFVDGDNGVSIDECRLLSKHLSGELDTIDYSDGAYILEVSSPGVDKPLLFLRQYAKHTGREFKIILQQNTELFGKLEKIEGELLTLHLKDTKKAYIAKEPIYKTIDFKDIKESVVQISFK